MKIILCGPPHSGKSCMREGLKQAIRAIPRSQYPYFITACPDGEGAWFQETANRSPEEARKLKDDYKKAVGGFSPEFVERIANSIRDCPLPLALADIGGIPDEKNKEICEHATHAIILFNDQCRVDEWRRFCHELNITIIAEIYSDYRGKEDTVGITEDIFTGTIHHLERGEDVSRRNCIRALAKYLVRLTSSDMGEESMATYNINVENEVNGDTILRLSFSRDQADSDRIVRDVKKRLDDLKLDGGRLIKLNGPVSMPVIAVIASHRTMHGFTYMGVCDPKLGKYVIVAAHGPEYQVGDLID